MICGAPFQPLARDTRSACAWRGAKKNVAFNYIRQMVLLAARGQPLHLCHGWQHLHLCYSAPGANEVIQ